MTVGATCSSGCVLTGQIVEIHDGSRLVAQRTLSSETLGDAQTLYRTEIELMAPTRVGATTWEASFAPSTLPSPHSPSQFRFGTQIVPSPECKVVVRVIDEISGEAVPGAQVRLGVYASHSDGDGFARFETSKGIFELDALKPGYDATPIPVEVSDDSTFQMAMKAVPKEPADNYWYHAS